MAVKTLDPSNITGRTYKQFARLLDMLEDPDNDAEVTIPQLINALKALQAYDLAAVRKEIPDERAAGSAVRKYSKAFKADASGRRAARAGPRAVSSGGDGEDDDDGDAA